MFRRGFLMLIALAMVTPALAAPAPVTTILIVRHAEKAGPTGDVPLSVAGVTRAKELARVLADVPLAAIYVTPFVRTRSTAAPIAEQRGLTPVVIDTATGYEQRLLDAIRRDHTGGTVLVVSHSNTIPAILSLLGIASPPTIAETEYDDLFVCTIAGTGPSKLLKLRYGAAGR